jgi:hypothetical protein
LQHRLEETKELEEKQAEIYNHLTGDLLTENPDVANSNLGPNRKIGYLYKGMTPEEHNSIRKEQIQQIAENKVSFSSDLISYQFLTVIQHYPLNILYKLPTITLES